MVLKKYLFFLMFLNLLITENLLKKKLLKTNLLTLWKWDFDIIDMSVLLWVLLCTGMCRMQDDLYMFMEICER